MTEPKKEAPPSGADIAKKTMTGDLRDAILQLVQSQKKPWAQIGEAEQRGIIANVEQRVGHMVNSVIDIISADGRKTIIGKLDSVTVKDGLKAVVTLSKDSELRHDLVDSQGSLVALVVADREAYTGQKAEAKVDKDQPALKIDKDDKPVADAGKNIPQQTKADVVDRGAVRK